MGISAAGKAMLDRAGEAADFLRSLANEHRLAILCALEGGAQSVGDLAELLGLSQPNVSQHLSRLKAQGLVKAKREGTTIYYSAGSGAAGAIVQVLKAEFCAAAPVACKA